MRAHLSNPSPQRLEISIVHDGDQDKMVDAVLRLIGRQTARYEAKFGAGRFVVGMGEPPSADYGSCIVVHDTHPTAQDMRVGAKLHRMAHALAKRTGAVIDSPPPPAALPTDDKVGETDPAG